MEKLKTFNNLINLIGGRSDKYVSLHVTSSRVIVKGLMFSGGFYTKDGKSEDEKLKKHIHDLEYLNLMGQKKMKVLSFESSLDNDDAKFFE